MNLTQLLTANRSYRRFYQNRLLNEKTLLDLIESTRLCPSGANRQPLKYLTVCTEEENASVFPHLGWAKWLPDWPGPSEGERPSGYIVILGDREIARRFEYDAGIAAFAILLAATERGLGGCMITWIDRDALAQTLNIPEQYEILLTLALGEPKETVLLEDTDSPGDIAYWRDGQGIHHVPKRPLEELVVRFPQPAAISESVVGG